MNFKWYSADFSTELDWLNVVLEVDRSDGRTASGFLKEQMVAEYLPVADLTD